jgi:hypothetical protein
VKQHNTAASVPVEQGQFTPRWLEKTPCERGIVPVAIRRNERTLNRLSKCGNLTLQWWAARRHLGLLITSGRAVGKRRITLVARL